MVTAWAESLDGHRTSRDLNAIMYAQRDEIREE